MLCNINSALSGKKKLFISFSYKFFKKSITMPGDI